MPNMYTCIAYLIEIRKFCSKNLVHKGVNFEAQNALKVTYAPLISKNSGGYTPGPPLKGGGEGRREGEEKEGAREWSPPIHTPGYATGQHVCIGYKIATTFLRQGNHRHQTPTPARRCPLVRHFVYMPLSRHYYSWPLRNKHRPDLIRKPEVQNVSQRRQSKTKPRHAQIICTENLLKI